MAPFCIYFTSIFPYFAPVLEFSCNFVSLCPPETPPDSRQPLSIHIRHSRDRASVSILHQPKDGATHR